MEPKDLAKLVLISNPALDGGRGYFVYTKINIKKDRYDSSIWEVDLSSLEKRAILPGPADIAPLPKDGRIAFLSRRGLGKKSRGIGLWILERGGVPRRLAYFPLGVLDLSWSPDGSRLAVVAYRGRPEKDVKHVEGLPLWMNDFGFSYNVESHLYLVDAASGVKKAATEGWARVRHAAWSPDGRYIAYTVARDQLRPYLVDLVVYDVAAKTHKVLARGLESAHHVAWSPKSDAVAVAGHKMPRGFASHNRIYVYWLDGSERCLTCNFDRNVVNTLNSDVRGPSYAPVVQWAGDFVYFVATVGGSAELYRVDMDGKVERVIGGEGVVDEFAVDGSGRILYTFMTADSPKELYLYEGGRIERLTSFNDFAKESLGFLKPEHFTFKASDGADIEGWALMPKGAGKRPWVLYIHGGPKTAYGWSFMFEFQLLASKGYAVVYTNPRGSDGYSEEFADIRCRYGERDYQDLMEAVDYVLARFELDERRAAVAGGSYGGFMTNWIVTHTDRFAAAITQRSICDWISMFGTTDIGWYFVEDQICCTPWRDRDRCIEKSPLFYAGRVKTPTLVIHSIEDYRTWLDQGVAFYTALKLNGVETKLVLFPGESHELTRKGKPRHRIEDLKQKLEWLDRHLGKNLKSGPG
ncbi:acylamino-acid-releasing enzyme, putative [Thermoproteus uzoniensis 768-20]|uniref:Acyl-peptide hydrolase n=1 Tax=Thermoproteus uzoniensis (strain 768-20) TaxID=999630 RepID=F2L3H9_THEU7|nr:S9 family peptidase [Thermoproteus uzoniensis]AEA13218.1 acylamino-acid-releasing enzyme, putative [Thermoproteus uzoniensis 768-20]